MRQESTRSRSSSVMPSLLLAGVLAAAALGGWYWWLNRSTPAEPSVAPAESPPAAPPVAAVSAEPPAAAEPTPPAIEHPMPPEEEPLADAPPGLPSLDESDALLAGRLTDLLGRDGVRQFVFLDSFVRRTVATIDNLPSQQAPVLMWPLRPTPERFTVRASADGREEIHPDNSQRYVPLVRMIESVDADRAVAVYRRLYPLFQQAYEDLGYPGKYFNDRLVQVLDHLLATPVPEGPLTVTLVQVKGSVPSLRPWVRYEWADPQWQAMSAGQKMLMRVGADNQRRLQAKLREIRQRVARRP